MTRKNQGPKATNSEGWAGISPRRQGRNERRPRRTRSGGQSFTDRAHAARLRLAQGLVHVLFIAFATVNAAACSSCQTSSQLGRLEALVLGVPTDGPRDLGRRARARRGRRGAHATMVWGADGWGVAPAPRGWAGAAGRAQRGRAGRGRTSCGPPDACQVDDLRRQLTVNSGCSSVAHSRRGLTVSPCPRNVGTVTRAPLLAILALTAAGMFGGLDGVDARVDLLEPRRQADVVNDREQPLGRVLVAPSPRRGGRIQSEVPCDCSSSGR